MFARSCSDGSLERLMCGRAASSGRSLQVWSSCSGGTDSTMCCKCKGELTSERSLEIVNSLIGCSAVGQRRWSFSNDVRDGLTPRREPFCHHAGRGGGNERQSSRYWRASSADSGAFAYCSLGEQEQRRLQDIADRYHTEMTQRATLRKWKAKLCRLAVRCQSASCPSHE
jgi:hypothetical protein